MIPNEGSFSITILFLLIVLYCIFWIVKYFTPSKVVLCLVLTWLVLQGLLGFFGFYEVNNTIPPRFVLMVLPPLLFLVILFNTKKGKAYIDKLEIEKLTLIHIIRIPVELALYGLFVSKMIPQMMTFEGANFDIISGISAPLVYFILIRKNKFNSNWLLIWNIICLLLLLIIVFIAIFSAPSPFQKLNFNQPNIGILYFPFNWLPSFIVPLVLFAHLASIRKILFLPKQ